MENRMTNLRDGAVFELEQTKLADGRNCVLKLYIPPVALPDLTAVSELPAGGDAENERSIASRLAGKYAADSEDRYYFAFVEGRVAARAWYGYGFSPCPVANFGQVYTQPEFRRLGLANRLMKWIARDLETGPVQGAFCCAGTPKLAQFYAPYGFYPVLPGTDCGPLGWLCGRVSFPTFAERYYRPADRLERRPGAMRVRHEIDRLLAFFLAMRSIRRSEDCSWRVSSFQQALFLQEDGSGFVDVFQTPDGRPVGWEFYRASAEGRLLEAREIHPDYIGLPIV